jgi:hypothetical protein
MKVNKQIMKSIVKECLIEILAEGLVSTNKPKPRRTNKNNQLRKKLSEVKNQSLDRHNNQSNLNNQRNYLEKISYGNTDTSTSEQQQSKRFKKITKDPIMQSILSDTASTTLLEQKESGLGRKNSMNSRPADEAAKIVSQADPTELFGNASKNWELLAFS